MYDTSKVTIIIPAKDEGAGLKKIIKSIKSYAKEIIVVDGHSKDKTREIAKEEKVLYILDHGKGRGDGVRMGIKAAKNEVVVLFDADGSHEARDIPRFVTPILAKEAELVIGSRVRGGSFDTEVDLSGIVRSLGCNFLAFIVNRKFKTELTDVIYSFRAIRKSTALKIRLTSNDFRIEPEMVVKCLKHGYKVKEIATREKKRAWGKSKLKTLTGIQFISTILRQ